MRSIHREKELLRQQIREAEAEFLKAGNKITRLEYGMTNYDPSISSKKQRAVANKNAASNSGL